MKKFNLRMAGLALGAALLFSGCNQDKPKTEATQPEQKAPEKPVVKAPEFNADSAYYYVKKQVDFGPRVPNTPKHRQTGDWLIQEFKSLGAQVQVQSFQMTAYDGTRLDLRNIVASYNPELPNRILLAAHWDTRPFADKDSVNQKKPIDGANDGGSGVGVLLEIARVLNASGKNPGVGIDIILFDGEDYGQPENSGLPYVEHSYCLGSQYWSKNKHKPGYNASYGILLDMVGAKNAKFGKEGYSRQYAMDIVNKVWQAAHRLGYGEHFINQDTDAITDDHVYVMMWGGIRMIDIIEYNTESTSDYFGHYHHRHSDNMDIIDAKTLKAVGQTVLHVLFNENPPVQQNPS